MDAVTRKLCALLDRDDVELQCSAARVLGELGSAGREVRLCLAKHLKTQNLTLKHYLLSALERLPGREALPYLFPLLREGGKVQERALALIGSCGPAAVQEGRRLFAGADEEFRKLIVRIFGALGTVEACAFLVGCIPGATPDLRRSVGLALREAMEKLPAAGKKLLLKKIDALFSSPKGTVSAEVAAAGVMLLGCAADPASLGKLIRAAAPDQPAPVREQALLAWRGSISRARAREVVAALVPALRGVRLRERGRHALACCTGWSSPGPWRRSSTRSSAGRTPRCGASSKMSAFGSKENIARLIEHLNAGSFDERRAAQEALAGIPAAAAEILKELDAAKDYQGGDAAGEHPQGAGAKPDAAEKRRLFDRMEKLRAAGDARAAAHAAALTVADPAFLISRCSAWSGG